MNFRFNVEVCADRQVPARDRLLATSRAWTLHFRTSIKKATSELRRQAAHRVMYLVGADQNRQALLDCTSMRDVLHTLWVSVQGLSSCATIRGMVQESRRVTVSTALCQVGLQVLDVLVKAGRVKVWLQKFREGRTCLHRT